MGQNDVREQALKRRQEIARRVVAKESYQDIADAFGISRQRVQKIALTEGVVEPGYRKEPCMSDKQPKVQTMAKSYREYLNTPDAEGNYPEPIDFSKPESPCQRRTYQETLEVALKGI